MRQWRGCGREGAEEPAADPGQVPTLVRGVAREVAAAVNNPVLPPPPSAMAFWQWGVADHTMRSEHPSAAGHRQLPSGKLWTTPSGELWATLGGRLRGGCRATTTASASPRPQHGRPRGTEAKRARPGQRRTTTQADLAAAGCQPPHTSGQTDGGTGVRSAQMELIWARDKLLSLPSA